MSEPVKKELPGSLKFTAWSFVVLGIFGSLISLFTLAAYLGSDFKSQIPRLLEKPMYAPLAIYFENFLAFAVIQTAIYLTFTVLGVMLLKRAAAALKYCEWTVWMAMALTIVMTFWMKARTPEAVSNLSLLMNLVLTVVFSWMMVRYFRKPELQALYGNQDV